MQANLTHTLEALYALALNAVASGAPYSEFQETARALYGYPVLDVDIRREGRDAYRDAIRQGVAREDVDPSWYAK